MFRHADSTVEIGMTKKKQCQSYSDKKTTYLQVTVCGEKGKIVFLFLNMHTHNKYGPL